MISVIIPTYNERENLKKIIPMIHDVLKDRDYEIVVVDDNSPDGTWEIAKELSKEYPVKLLMREERRGLATAVIDGIKIAEGKIIVVMDADLQHPPEYIPRLIEPIINDGVDLVIGSRYVKGGKIKEWGFVRRLISKGATFLSHIAVLKLRGIKDTMSGFFALKKSAIEGVELNPLGYKILLEILVKGNIRRVREVPYVFEKRYAGESKLGSREIFGYVKHLIQLSLWTGDFWRILKYVIVGLSGLFINLLILYSLIDLRFLELTLGIFNIHLPNQIKAFTIIVPKDILVKVLAASVSIELSIIWNFMLNNFWTFKDRTKKGWNAVKALFKFNLVSVGGILINLAIYTLLLTTIGMHYLIAETIAVFVAFAWNFIINDTWTWDYTNHRLS